jgi:hypothetical protein
MGGSRSDVEKDEDSDFDPEEDVDEVCRSRFCELALWLTPSQGFPGAKRHRDGSPYQGYCVRALLDWIKGENPSDASHSDIGHGEQCCSILRPGKRPIT